MRLTTARVGSGLPFSSTAHAVILYVCGWSYVGNVNRHDVVFASGLVRVACTTVTIGAQRPVSPPPQPTGPQKYSVCSMFWMIR